MAVVKYLGQEALEQIVKEVPQLIAGDNISVTPDETEPNKMTISMSIDLAEKSDIEELFKDLI